MMRMEIDTAKGQVTIHVDDEGAQTLADAGRDAKDKKAKVIIGDPGALLIVRHEDYE